MSITRDSEEKSIIYTRNYVYFHACKLHAKLKSNSLFKLGKAFKVMANYIFIERLRIASALYTKG